MPQSISSLKSQRKERTLLNMGKNHVSQNDMVYLSRKKLSPMIIIPNHCWPYEVKKKPYKFAYAAFTLSFFFSSLSFCRLSALITIKEVYAHAAAEHN